MSNTFLGINSFYPKNYYSRYNSSSRVDSLTLAANCTPTKQNNQTTGCWSLISRVRYNNMNMVASSNNFNVIVQQDNQVIFNISNLIYQGQLCVHYLGLSNTSESVYESCRVDYTSKFNIILEATFNQNLTNDNQSTFTIRPYLSQYSSTICQSSLC